MRRSIVMCSLSLLSLSAAQSSRAGSWSLEPRASLNVGYNDNIRFSIDTPVSDSNETLELASSVTHHDDQLDIAFDPRVTLVRYQEQSVFDRNDVSVEANSTYKSERAQWFLSGNYIRDTTLTSELGSTGLTETNRTHESESIVLSPTWQYSQRLSVMSQASWSANSYIDALGTGLVDYDYHSAMAKTRYALSERSLFSFDASFGRLLVPSQQSVSNNYAANLSWQTALFDRWRLSLAAGPTRVESERISDNGTGYSANLTYQVEIGNYTLSASRDVTPTGRGILSKRERVVLSGGFNLTERLSSNGSMQWVRNEDLFPSLGLRFGTIRYLSVSAGLQWRVTPTIFATMTINGSNQRSDARDGTARNYSGSVGIVWNGLGQQF